MYCISYVCVSLCVNIRDIGGGEGSTCHTDICGGQRLMWRCLPRLPHIAFWDRIFHWTQSSPFHLDWIARETLGLTCLWPAGPEVIDMNVTMSGFPVGTTDLSSVLILAELWLLSNLLIPAHHPSASSQKAGMYPLLENICWGSESKKCRKPLTEASLSFKPFRLSYLAPISLCFLGRVEGPAVRAGPDAAPPHFSPNYHVYFVLTDNIIYLPVFIN